MSAPGITWMDPGELAQAAYNLGGAHAPGHPAHSLLGKLATLIPIGEIAFRLNLLSALAMAAVVAGTAALCQTLLDSERVAPVVAAALVALSPVVQINAVRTEVYAPAAALVIWAMVAVVGFVRSAAPAARPGGDDAGSGAPTRTGDGRQLLVAALCLGLCAAFHPLIAAAAALPMALSVGLAARGRLRRLLPAATVLVGLALALYLYLPVRAAAARPPVLMWGQPEALDTLIALLSGAAYRDNFAASGVLDRFAELFMLAGDVPGAGLVWVGFLGLVFAALTGLPGACVILAVALTVIAAAATQHHTNPDMPGYILPAVALLAVGLAPLCGAIGRILPAELRRSTRLRAVASAVILVPVVGFAMAAPTYYGGDAGPQRSDDPLRLWSHTVARMPPGPGVYFADSDHGLFSAQYEQLVAGGRPDIALASAELCRDRWFLAHLKRAVPELHVPYIDDGMRGQLAARLVAETLGRGWPVGGERPSFGPLDIRRTIAMGRAYRYLPAPAAPDEEAAAAAEFAAPPQFGGDIGRRISGLIGLTRARFELSRGRVAAAASAIGQDARLAARSVALPGRMAAATERPPLLGRLPRVTRVFIYERWQGDLFGDELAWRTGLPPDALAAPERAGAARTRPPMVAERRLHRLWRKLLSTELGDGMAASADSVWTRSPELLDALSELGRDAEMATAQLLAATGRDRAAETLLRAVIERRGADEMNLLLLGSVLGNRGTAEALAAAEALFARAIEVAPDRAEPWVRMGVVQGKQGRFDEARRSLRRALELQPERDDAAALLRQLGP
ncbi:MAG: DUF2723 domain-containing protein [Myxococcota bacterium]